MTQKATIGRTVIFVPNGSENHQLPNGMQEAPAVVVQTFEGSSYVNLNIFTAETNNNKSPIIVGWSIVEGSEKTYKGIPYWKWPKIERQVTEIPEGKGLLEQIEGNLADKPLPVKESEKDIPTAPPPPAKESVKKSKK
jgi:hypothetical protein